MNPVYIVGYRRSGTTLLGAMLGGNSKILCIPEAQFFHEPVRLYYKSEIRLDLAEVIKRIKSHWRFKIWEFDISDDEIIKECGNVNRFDALIRAFIACYGKSVGKSETSYWIDHTSSNVNMINTLSEIFPESRFIHMVRDVRGVAASVIPLSWGPNNVLEVSKEWKEQLAYGLVSEITLGPEKVIRVKFEELIEKPREVMEKLCSWLDIDFNPAMLNGSGYRMPWYHYSSHRLVEKPPEKDRAYAWKEILSKRDVEIIEVETYDLLRSLGYEPQSEFSVKRIATVEKYSMLLRSFLRRITVNKIKYSMHRKKAIQKQTIGK